MTSKYVAKRLPKFAGKAAWDVILGQRSPPNPLDGETNCDFVVIGAGFAGLSAARRLAQLNNGARIVVLDAGRVGEGAAGRNSGFMIDLPHELTSADYAGTDESTDRKLIRLNRLAIEFARDAVLDYEIDAGYFDPAGKVNGAGSEVSHAQNQSYAAHLDELSERYELLDAKTMFELTGSRYYLSGLYTPGTVMLQPAGYVRGVANGLSGAVTIHENSPVTSVERKGSVWCIKTPGGSVAAPRVVMANNGQIESFGFKPGRLMHVFLFACMTEELGADALQSLGGKSRWGITPSNPMGTTLRRIDTQQGGNRIVTRTCAQFRPNMESSPREMRRAATVMREKFDARFPKLAHVQMEYVWSGHLCLSRNGVSVTGEIEDGIFAACCQNGLGTTRGTLTGMAAAEVASNHSSDITSYFSRQPEPSRLPPASISTLGAAAVLRWKEWQARKE